jgi:pimeloyl-ACP methyl ester carboxylesterase
MKRGGILLRAIILLGLVFAVVPEASSQDTVKFTHGLITGGGGMYTDRSAFTSDPVAWMFITGNEPRPVEGNISFTPPEGITFQQPPLPNPDQKSADNNRPPMGQDQRESHWSKIDADSNGLFTAKDIRGGGIYLEYNSPEEKTMLLVVAGNTLSVVNGIPLEGDVYNWDYSVRPVRIKKGINSIYLTMGRFQGVKAVLVAPSKPVTITLKDMTVPDLIMEEQTERYGAVQVINATPKELSGWSLKCIVNGRSAIKDLPVLLHENTRKLPFIIPAQGNIEGSDARVQLVLLSPAGKKIDRIEFNLKNEHFTDTHDRTFISSIDGSVQYLSVTPDKEQKKGEALFLSVHGAGVEARNQARAYKPKDWGNLVAATNRRPYGFNWEDWGRLDALEVLAEARKLFDPDPARIYLTGHSMGGHGTWYLGATYPSYFAAIAPSAGYPDLLNYGFRSGVNASVPAGEMMLRANNPSRTISLARNYLHYGVYIFHGDADETVPVEQAREMRKLLGTFHPDFSYYEYPGGHHWISDESVDWPPIFDFFKRHTIPSDISLLKIEFHTANPGVSATSHWLTISQQARALMPSAATVSIDTSRNVIDAKTENVALMSLNSSNMKVKFPVTINIDSIKLISEKPDGTSMIWLENKDGRWNLSAAPDASLKNPLRNGTFKDAFRNMMVFVYGTGGTSEENDWMYYKARYDASTFGYRGNGSIEVISDKSFDPAKYAERNVIIYGNIKNNSAWKKVLKDCPVETGNGYVWIGMQQLSGDNLACFFIYPRSGSKTASVGVISATGIKGLKGAYTNQYLNSASGFPDVTVITYDAPLKGYRGVLCTGFFGNTWQTETGEFWWK